MNDIGIFIFGCIVFSIVLAAVSLLVIGASNEPRAAGERRPPTTPEPPGETPTTPES